MILEHGQVFAGPRVLGLLGQGAFGSVYRVVGPDGTEAALKLLNAMGLASEAHRRRLGKLRHPNVLQLTSHGQEAGAEFLLLEFVQGTTLESRVLDGGPLAMEEVANLGAKLAGAVAAAHALGLVHRDVKPTNVILRVEDGFVLEGARGPSRRPGGDPLAEGGCSQQRPRDPKHRGQDPRQARPKALSG